MNLLETVRYAEDEVKVGMRRMLKLLRKPNQNTIHYLHKLCAYRLYVWLMDRRFIIRSFVVLVGFRKIHLEHLSFGHKESKKDNVNITCGVRSNIKGNGKYAKSNQHVITVERIVRT